MDSSTEQHITHSRLIHRLALPFSSAFVRSVYGKKISSVGIRHGTTDDWTFLKIFLFREYSFSLPLRPRFIIDGGANAGFSPIFFSIRYPEAQIAAVEPEITNYQFLQKNCRLYPNITAHHGGFHHSRGFLQVYSDVEKRKKDSFRTRVLKKGGASGVRSFTIDEIRKMHGFKKIDILKLDIEGAERELFSKNYKSWLGDVNVLMVELHDRLASDCSRTFFNAVEQYPFKKFQKGETHILVRSELFSD